MGNARVTIGLPFHNAARTLSDAVRSIFAQTLADWRLLLVDDGSNDRSLEIASGIREPRVFVLSDGANRGLAQRLNQITGLAESEFVARMDADDLMHPDRLRRQISFFEEFPDTDVVGTATYTIDAHSCPLGRRGDRPVDARISSVLEHAMLIHPTVMARRGAPHPPRLPGDLPILAPHRSPLWTRHHRPHRDGRASRQDRAEGVRLPARAS